MLYYIILYYRDKKDLWLQDPFRIMYDATGRYIRSPLRIRCLRRLAGVLCVNGFGLRLCVCVCVHLYIYI